MINRHLRVFTKNTKLPYVILNSQKLYLKKDITEDDLNEILKKHIVKKKKRKRKPQAKKLVNKLLSSASDQAQEAGPFYGYNELGEESKIPLYQPGSKQERNIQNRIQEEKTKAYANLYEASRISGSSPEQISKYIADKSFSQQSILASLSKTNPDYSRFLNNTIIKKNTRTDTSLDEEQKKAGIQYKSDAPVKPRLTKSKSGPTSLSVVKSEEGEEEEGEEEGDKDASTIVKQEREGDSLESSFINIPEPKKVGIPKYRNVEEDEKKREEYTKLFDYIKGVKEGNPLKGKKTKSKELMAFIENTKTNNDSAHIIIETVHNLPRAEFLAKFDRGPGSAGNGHKIGDILSDDQINIIMHPYKNFIGTYTIDELPIIHNVILKKNCDECCCIINTQKRNTTTVGHWIAIWMSIDDASLEIYDPLAENRPDMYNSIKDEFEDILEELKISHYMKLKINSVRNQRINSSTCGWHCIAFLLQRLVGIPFDEASGYHNTAEAENEAHRLENKYNKFGYI